MVRWRTSDTIYGYFEKAAQRFRSNRAMIFLGTQYSYAQLKEAIERFAASLHELGVKRGDKTILYLSNSPQWIIAWFALLRLGGVPVPISPIYSPAELIYMANDSEAETVFLVDRLDPRQRRIRPRTLVAASVARIFAEVHCPDDIYDPALLHQSPER